MEHYDLLPRHPLYGSQIGYCHNSAQETSARDRVLSLRAAVMSCVCAEGGAQFCLTVKGQVKYGSVGLRMRICAHRSQISIIITVCIRTKR